MKTYQVYFEGVIEVEAENEDKALEQAIDTFQTADVGYWDVKESDPDRM